jgi:hypothetical protein
MPFGRQNVPKGWHEVCLKSRNQKQFWLEISCDGMGPSLRLTTREVQGHLEEICGVDVSPSFDFLVIDAVVEEVNDLQSWPLEP